MVIGIRNGILNDPSSGFFPNKPFEKKPMVIIQDSDLYSNNHFVSHLFGNGLYLLAQLHTLYLPLLCIVLSSCRSQTYLPFSNCQCVLVHSPFLVLALLHGTGSCDGSWEPATMAYLWKRTHPTAARHANATAFPTTLVFQLQEFKYCEPCRLHHDDESSSTRGTKENPARFHQVIQHQ